MTDFAFENIKDQFKADVDVGVSDSARRNSGDVRGEFGRAHVFGRHALLVMDPVPISPRPAAANGQDAVVILDRAAVDLVDLAFHDAIPLLSEHF